MKYIYRSCVVIFSFCYLAASASLAQEASLESDMKLMLQWFAGEFDNFQQVWLEKEQKVEQPHEHIHSIFAPIKLPFLGENVFYVKQYMDGNPQKIYRQRLYNFKTNPVEKAIQLDIYSFLVDSLYDDAHLKPEKLKNLSLAQLSTISGCAVYWRKQNDKFMGYMKEKACNFVSKRSGKKIYITDSLQLSQTEIWIRDEAYDEDGKYVFGHRGKIHHKLKKCRMFKGWAVIQKESGKADDYYVMRDIILHDQGQKTQIIDKDGTKTNYWVELAQVVYQGGLPVLKLAIYEEGKEKALAYTWTNIEAKRIGINMRSHQAGFTWLE
jgi:hypothetical protein